MSHVEKAVAQAQPTCPAAISHTHRLFRHALMATIAPLKLILEPGAGAAALPQLRLGTVRPRRPGAHATLSCRPFPTPRPCSHPRLASPRFPERGTPSPYFPASLSLPPLPRCWAVWTKAPARPLGEAGQVSSDLLRCLESNSAARRHFVPAITVSLSVFMLASINSRSTLPGAKLTPFAPERQIPARKCWPP